MAVLATTNPTLLDLAKRTDPAGKIAGIVELLDQENGILEDMTWVEANGVTSHRTTVRTGLPAPTWRKMYGGVQPTKSTTRQITDNIAMLEAYAEVDKALADLNGNTIAFRMSEEKAHIEGMMQRMATTLFYGSEIITPESFTGFTPRFNLLSAENGQNIIDAGGTGSDNTSIWLVVWDSDKCHGIIPKGSQAGLQQKDKGEVTIQDVDNQGGRMEAYQSHYRWDCGLSVRDWRYVVRIANIDKSNLLNTAATGADISDLMVQAIERVHGLNGRPVFYVNRTIRSMLRRQQINATKNSTLTVDGLSGKQVLMFDGIPVRRVDALAADEARVV
jgi:hypothetical protein